MGLRINHNDSIGKVFGRLLVVNLIKFSRYYKYECLCECGKITKQYAQGLLKGTVKSCGCLHKEIIKQEKTKPRKDIRTGVNASAVNTVFNTYKRNAAKRGYEFLLTKEQFYNIIIQDCTNCGTKAYQKEKVHHHKFSPWFTYTGIDRIDNTKGYTIENSEACCTICNKAKGILTAEQFQIWINNLIEFQTKRKQNASN